MTEKFRDPFLGGFLLGIPWIDTASTERTEVLPRDLRVFSWFINEIRRPEGVIWGRDIRGPDTSGELMSTERGVIAVPAVA
ncbi:hypothetical protein DPMN_114724 [Dreissena polymorpha]|uniref:Uncharacterized protein n=1 Tax=Dreissena polymorpha TaxID=45954 RepID=A0A9D4KJY7_DREPO|nr:hypothetical protein DPMN_114724 [Dreissena polymorpha]